MGDSFEKALGIEPVKKVEAEILPPAKVEEAPVPALDEDTQEDYELSRNTFRSLIRKGNDAIEGITDLAKMSESPRAYEVLATLIKTVADTTKDLYDLQKKTKELKRLDDTGKPVSGDINVEKAVFVGTPAELLKHMKEAKKTEQ